MKHAPRKRIILVDMDSTLCQFVPKLLCLAHEKLGAPLLDAALLTQFHTEDEFESSLRDHIAALSDEPGFFEDLEPMDGATAAMGEMEEAGYRVFICTAPKKFYNNPHCAGEKHRWVMRHLGRKWTEKIILTRDKTLVFGDVLIDDKPEVEGAVTPSWNHVYFDQPYNRENSDRPRIRAWKDWRSVIEGVLR